MKKLFFILAFMLISTFTFASGNDYSEEMFKKYGVMVTTSCGETGLILFDTLQEGIELAMDMDEWLCG